MAVRLIGVPQVRYLVLNSVTHVEWTPRAKFGRDFLPAKRENVIPASLTSGTK
jgi:hypothetical protein